MKIQVFRNYSYPDLLRQTPGGMGKWGKYEFSFSPLDKSDFVVVLNRPLENIKTTCLKGGRIIVMQEPPYPVNNYFKLHFRFYDKIISGFESNDIFLITNSQAGLPWHVNKSYDELKSLEIGINKVDRVSWITSNNLLFPGHLPRLEFIEYLNQINFDYDLFGRGFNPIKDKFDGIYPYKYTIAVENYAATDYFTEKITDAYLSWSLPFYSGCTNLEKYFPKESFVKINIKNKKEAADIIKESIANKVWEKNVEAIRYARELVLDKYQFFPMIASFMDQYLTELDTKKYSRISIPAEGITRSESLKKKIRTLLGMNKIR